MMNPKKGEAYDKMVLEKSNDELGLFEKYEQVLEKIQDMVRKQDANSIIDFGCGTGNLCGPLSESIKVTGIDKNAEMLEQGKRKFPSMHFMEQSFLHVSNLVEIADLVVSSYVLHGLPGDQQKQAIREMLRLSKKKRVILADFMFESHKARQMYKDTLLDANKQELWDFIDSKHYFIVHELSEYLHGLGLQAEFEHVVNFTWVVQIHE